jgi:hypothetical protein
MRLASISIGRGAHSGAADDISGHKMLWWLAARPPGEGITSPSFYRVNN